MICCQNKNNSSYDEQLILRWSVVRIRTTHLTMNNSSYDDLLSEQEQLILRRSVVRIRTTHLTMICCQNKNNSSYDDLLSEQEQLILRWTTHLTMICCQNKNNSKTDIATITQYFHYLHTNIYSIVIPCNFWNPLLSDTGWHSRRLI